MHSSIGMCMINDNQPAIVFVAFHGPQEVGRWRVLVICHFLMWKSWLKQILVALHLEKWLFMVGCVYNRPFSALPVVFDLVFHAVLVENTPELIVVPCFCCSLGSGENTSCSF